MTGFVTGPCVTDAPDFAQATPTLAACGESASCPSASQGTKEDVAARLGVSLDTKMLTDKTGDVLNGILVNFRKHKNVKALVIIRPDPDDDYAPYAQDRQAPEWIRHPGIGPVYRRRLGQAMPVSKCT